GAVDAAHAADADQLEDHVAAGERGAEERIVPLARQLPDREAAMRAELVALLARVSTLRADDLRHGLTLTRVRGVGPARASRSPSATEAAPSPSVNGDSVPVSQVGLTSSPMPTPRLRLGQLLVDARMISPAALDEVLALQRTDGRRLGTLLVERGLINET